MIVYHGGIDVIEKPDINHSYRPLDFGKGFYITTIKEQAEKWAKRKADIFDKDVAVVNCDEMKDHIEAVKVLKLDNENKSNQAVEILTKPKDEDILLK